MFFFYPTGDMKIEILNKRGEQINRLPGHNSNSKKLLVELKVIWHGKGVVTQLQIPLPPPSSLIPCSLHLPYSAAPTNVGR